MANSVTFTDNSFVGEVAEQLIIDCISPNKTVDGGHIYLQTGINKKLYLPRVQLNGEIIQHYTPTPTEQGEFDFTERELPVEYLQTYLVFHPNEFRDYWTEFAPSFQQLLTQTTLPTQVLNPLTDLMVRSTSRDIAKAIWQGNKGASPTPSYPNNLFVGIIPKLESEAGTINVPSPVALTAANVEDEMFKVYDLIPDQCLDLPDMKFFVSTKTAKLLQAAATAISGKGPTFLQVNGLDDISFYGIPVIRLNEFPNDTIVAAESGAIESSNFHFGATNYENHSIFRIDRVQTNSELYFMKMIYAAGTEVSKPEEVVLYKA